MANQDIKLDGKVILRGTESTKDVAFYGGRTMKAPRNAGAGFTKQENPFNLTEHIEETAQPLINAAVAPDYTEYRAFLSQSGTDAPFEDNMDGTGNGSPFIDTIGGVWTRTGVGTYNYTKVGAFTDVNKIEFICSKNSQEANEVNSYFTKLDDDTLELSVYTVAYTGGISTPVDSRLYLQHVVIRVYS